MRIAAKVGCKTLPEFWLIISAMSAAVVIALLLWDGPPKWQAYAVNATEASYPVALLAITVVGLLDRLKSHLDARGIPAYRRER